MTVIFDGNQVAAQDLAVLQEKVKASQATNGLIKVAVIVFKEDEGGLLYTRKKAAAAKTVGIDYQPFYFSLRNEADQGEAVKEKIRTLSDDKKINGGIIIQKPMRRVYAQHQPDSATDFADWWQELTSLLPVAKDVDGLNPQLISALEQGTWEVEGRVLPATVRAVLKIMVAAGVQKDQRLAIIGRSDLLGLPLAAYLKNQGYQVELMGRAGLRERIARGENLFDLATIISATGQEDLITADLVSEGVVAIDVGEPVGDFDFETVAPKARFITPVPGGVGPLTVVSLLENAFELSQRFT